MARVSVTIESDGSVSAIELLDTNSARQPWNRMAALALAKLRGKTLRVPDGRRLELVLEVESKVTLPSGAKPKSGVSVLGIPFGQTEARHDPTISFLTPHVDLKKKRLPKPGNPDEEMELPVLEMGLSVLEMGTELVDIGAHTRQVVHTKLLSQRVL